MIRFSKSKWFIDLLGPSTFSIIILAAFALVLYLGAAMTSIYMRNESGPTIIFWCANCLFLMCLVKYRFKYWLRLILFITLLKFAIHIMTGEDIYFSIATIVSDLFKYTLLGIVADQLNREGYWYLSLKKSLTIPLTTIVAAIGGAAIEATWTGAGADSFTESTFQVNFLSESLSLLVSLTFVLSWADSNLVRNLNDSKFLELVILTAICALAGYYLFESKVSFLFVIFPLLLLSTLRGGMLAGTASVTCLYLLVIYYSSSNQNLIISVNPLERTNILLFYYLFIVTALLSTFPLGILLARLENSTERLREAGIVAEQARQDAETARDRAQKAGEVKGDFLSAMSHELRTPLTGVLGLVDLLHREELNDQQLNYVESIRTSGDHLLSIINDILDFSKIESGRLEIENIDVSIVELFFNVCETVRPLHQAKRIEFRSEIANEFPLTVVSDPTRLRQLMLNLIGNAIKFTDQGLVSVSLTQKKISNKESIVRFEVRDTGIGIAEDNKADIFNSFTQADRSTARRFGGNGLGLAICKRLISVMNGQIGFSSSQGLGSLFWFEIPVERGQHIIPSLAPIRLSGQKRRLKILLVEDVSLNRTIIGTMLKSEGHIISFAENGAQSIEMISKNYFDIVLMDIQMPVMDGIEATINIRNSDLDSKNIPIIALTANVIGKDRDGYESIGMNACISKPIDWSELTHCMERLTGLRATNSHNELHPSNVIEDISQCVDLKKLNSLSALMPNEIDKLLEQAISSADEFHARVSSIRVSPNDVASEAHALKGMAGMVGFIGIQFCAAEIEKSAKINAGYEKHVAELKNTIYKTQEYISNDRF